MQTRKRGRPPKVRVFVDPEPLKTVTVLPCIFEEEPRLQIPEDWYLGELLNVRHGGKGYRITKLGEEYDPRSPERCLEFSNSHECQQFVSAWYARTWADPRA